MFQDVSAVYPPREQPRIEKDRCAQDLIKNQLEDKPGQQLRRQ